jgi:serine phosphatase RsbU (regulator of sigma subunit)
MVVARVVAGEGAIVYGNAGHHPPFLVRGQDAGTTEALRPTGAAIGLVEGANFTESAVDLAPGDTLVFYTDGVVEARDRSGDEFGDEALARYAAENRLKPPAVFVRGLRQQLQDFTAGRTLADDTTIVALQRTG